MNETIVMKCDCCVSQRIGSNYPTSSLTLRTNAPVGRGKKCRVQILTQPTKNKECRDSGVMNTLKNEVIRENSDMQKCRRLGEVLLLQSHQPEMATNVLRVLIKNPAGKNPAYSYALKRPFQMKELTSGSSRLKTNGIVGKVVSCLIAFGLFIQPFFCFGAGEIDMNIIKQIESSGNPKAFNKITQARGLYQITPVVLEDYLIYGYTPNSYCLNYQIEIKDLDELFDPVKNYAIAYWYLNKRIPQMLEAYGLPVNTKYILWSYDAGIGKVRKGIFPKETEDYILKYNKARGE